MTPETKKTLIYGGVISLAVAIGAYLFERETGGSAAPADSGATAGAQVQAQAEAQAQEDQLAMLAELGSSGESTAPVSIGAETPVEDFSQEISKILAAAGLSSPSTANPSPSENNPATNPPEVTATTEGPGKTVPKPNPIVYRGSPVPFRGSVGS